MGRTAIAGFFPFPNLLFDDPGDHASPIKKRLFKGKVVDPNARVFYSCLMS